MPEQDKIIDRILLKSKLRRWQSLVLLLFVLLFFSFAGLRDVISLPTGALLTKHSGNGSKILDKFSRSKPYIAKVEISGLIDKNERLDNLIQSLKDNKKVLAVLVYVESRGGTFFGSESTYNKLKQLAKSKPVVAVMGSTAASGGYMVSIAAERVFASFSTLTGSIGVVMQYFSVFDAAKKLGINLESIASSKLKTAMSPLDKITDEGRAAMQDLVDKQYAHFLDIVSQNRKIDKTLLRKLADGRVYSGDQAVKFGLVDELGGEEEAVAWLVREKKISAEAEVVKVSPSRVTNSSFIKKFTNDDSDENGSIFNQKLDMSLQNSLALQVAKLWLSSGFRFGAVMAVWDAGFSEKRVGHQ